LGLPVLFPAFVGIVLVSAEVAGTAYGLVTMALFGAGYALLSLPAARSEERRDVASVSLGALDGASDGRRPRVVGAPSDELKG
jgi:hypothetical protein